MKCIVTKWNEKEGNELTSNGLIRINPNKPEFGSLMLLSVVTSLSDGFLNKRTKVGFIVGNIEDLNATIKEYKLKEGTDYSVAVAPVKIVTIEKLESDVPENQGFRAKINPSNDEELTKDGELIMWKTEVIAESSEIVDTLIRHDRESDIPAVDPAMEEFTGAGKDKDTK